MNKTITQQLLDIGAVVLSPNAPFTWSSGIKSPIYCDNRLLMSYPKVRRRVAYALEDIIRQYYPDVEVIAGTSTAGIPHAAWISENMNLPMVYVRSSVKSHGKQKQIEGLVQPGQKAVIIEDLISTGSSVMTTAQGLHEAGVDVVGVAAIFTYGLERATRAFCDAELTVHTISDFSILTNIAELSDEEQQKLNKWYANPDSEAWMDRSN